MNSFIYIDGIVLWLCMAILLMMLITYVIVGCAYIKVERNNYTLKEKNKKLKVELSVAQEKLYKVNFKVPEVDKDV